MCGWEPDVIDFYGNVSTVQDRLAAIHMQLRCEFPAIARVAVALYEHPTDTLRTFVHSTDGTPPFGRIVDKLSLQPALAELADRQMDRIITNLVGDDDWQREPPGTWRRSLANQGYLSSYTTPFYEHGSLLGFIFFDSLQPNYFSASVINRIALYSHLLTLFVIDFVRQTSVLRSAIAIARDFGTRRDKYTGAHLDRMAEYSRIIAHGISDACQLGEDFVECVFLFAPLHDIGKIAIPDEILLKRGRLTSAEHRQMQRHVSEGVAIIETMINAFRIGSGQLAQTLRNIVRFHHERYDGTGYLDGLTGEAIPIEARIISVADVFDALTGDRPYRSPMSNADAFTYLREGSGLQFDSHCVQALITRLADVEAVQAVFHAEAHASTA